LGENPDKFSAWMRERFGDELIDRLRYLHSLTIKLSAQDLKDIQADLKAQSEAMEVGDDFETPAVILLAIAEAERRRAA
jgi:protoporphyrinogen oxidase